VAIREEDLDAYTEGGGAGVRQGSGTDLCQPRQEVLVAIGSRRRVCSSYKEEDRELSSQTHCSRLLQWTLGDGEGGGGSGLGSI
jgi:hypothetical protein